MVDMVFLVFIGFLYPPPAWKVSLLRPEKFSKRFSFGGGCVRFCLLCFCQKSSGDPALGQCFVGDFFSNLETEELGP